VALDPFLYVALALGLLAGWIVRPTSPWVGRLTLATVAVLVGLLGASLTGIGADALLTTIPLALGLTALVLGLTTFAYLLLILRRPAPPPGATTLPPPDRFPISVALLAALVGGYAIGRLVTIPAGAAIPFALYALLALVGFGLHLSAARLPTLWIPLGAATAGAVGAALVFAALARTSLSIAFATTFGFGFYSLAGPLVEARAGAALGLLAFLANFFRENLTMLFAPVLGRRLRSEGLAAWGGATSMDTTLYFVTRYGDSDAAALAIANGLVLTLAASLLLPLFLAGTL
jgi:uncharacterized membrane protein YbjE (DUF340 family)